MTSNQGRLNYCKAKAELCSRNVERQIVRGEIKPALDNLMRVIHATEQARYLERKESEQ